MKFNCIIFFLWIKSDLIFIHYLVSHLMSSSNICYCFLFCLTSKVDLTSFIYIIDTSRILIYFLYRLSCPFSVGFPAFFLLNEQKVSLCMHRPVINTPHNRLKFILKCHSYFYTLTKGQIISKADCQAVNSSKKRMNEFVFTTMRRVFVCFLEEIEDTKMTFRN